MANGITNAIFSALVEQRPEFKNAMKVWTDVLEPVLAERESERRAIISKAWKRSAITAAIVGAMAIAFLILTGGAAVALTIILAAGITAIASGAAWIPLFTVKSQTKQLVVGAAAESFGFSYDTLHPDVSGIADWRSAGEWIKSQASQHTAAAQLFGGTSDEPAPTPAFDVLKEARLLPSYDDRKFEDLIQGDRAKTSFSLVECKLTEQQGSGKNRRTVTTFQGLLYSTFSTRSVSWGGPWWRGKGWWKGFFGDKTLQKVDLVAKELEDNFTIYSDDQVEARALFTPDRMERLIALERHFKGGKLRGSF